eukprot:CAMPEP_0198673052 /NCGR_PEP_ID=MMETSP1467-20131203/94320_1 /TAXON_ID=1462469 /ORGANISM="unid. sp., Strain CCMP2135" /LENGTH=57 /DNA_ID=CAMNT_0044409899 /DNA_START=25 /DNA_END=194 /DNA_ORIENTATION=-
MIKAQSALDAGLAAFSALKSELSRTGNARERDDSHSRQHDQQAMRQNIDDRRPKWLA